VVGFAEFIELLLLCACWRAPPPRALDSAHVLSAVRQLLDTLLSRARHVDVLGFRHACFASAPLLEALEALKPHLATAHAAYAHGNGGGGGSPGLGLAGFERLVDDAGLLADRLRDPGLRRSPRRAPAGEAGLTISVDAVPRAITSPLPA